MTLKDKIHRRDRWADGAVIGLVLVALALGWVLRQSVLFQTTPFELTEADIVGQYPAHWTQEFEEDPLLKVRDHMGGEFDSVLTLRSRPLADEADVAIVLDALSLERARAVIAYNTLDTNQVVVAGRTAHRRQFTYVHTDANPYVDRLPVVVRGTDLAFRDAGRIVVVTFLTGVDDYAVQYPHFRAFVESLVF